MDPARSYSDLRGQICSSECDWYHDAWPVLKSHGLVSNPDDHVDFYFRSLCNAARDGKNDVLISGCADESMLRTVMHAFFSTDEQPRITIVDICATPLNRSQAYATAAGLDIETVQHDVLHWDPRTSFDIIVTDAFLTRFRRPEKGLVLRKWKNVLRPDGVIITTAGLNPASHDGSSIRMTADQSREFVRQALTPSANGSNGLGEVPDSLSSLATSYTSRLITYPFRSKKQLTGAFDEAGLHVIETESDPTPREFIFAGVTRLSARHA